MDLGSSAVDRAGRVLRSVQSRDAAAQQDALDVLHEFRREHIAPLASATMGLRSALASRGLDGQVSQRLKRVPTILDKLARLPDLRLSQLQDIGGCRAVHLIVSYQRRQSEVQLRTRVMHLWALNVERLSAEFGHDLKESRDPIVRAYMSRIAEAMAIEEAGGRVDSRTFDEINVLRVSCMELLRGRQ